MTFLAHDAGDGAFALGAVVGIAWKKDHRDTVAATLWKRKVYNTLEEGVRNLQQDTSAIPGLRVTATCTPVHKIFKNL